jgi:hypothetical protein
MLRRYLRAILRHGWFLMIAVVGLLGDVATVIGNFNVPRPVWYVVIAIGVLGAQFLAYQDAVRDRDALDERLNDMRQDRDDVRAERDDMRRERDEALKNALPAYTDHIIERQRVYILDLVRELRPPIIERMVFVDCQLVGPVVVIFHPSCRLIDSRWFGLGEGALWPRITGLTTQGAVVFQECSFDRCRFEGIGVAVSDDPAELERVKRDMGLSE